MNKIIFMAVVSALIVGCSSTSIKNNSNILQSPEKLAYKACMKKNNGDKSKCEKERADYMQQQEMEVMENNG